MEGLPVRDQPMGGGNLQARSLQEEGEEGEKPEENFKTLNIWTFLEETTATPEGGKQRHSARVSLGREGRGGSSKKEHQNIYDEKRQDKKIRKREKLQKWTAMHKNQGHSKMPKILKKQIKRKKCQQLNKITKNLKQRPLKETKWWINLKWLLK